MVELCGLKKSFGGKTALDISELLLQRGLRYAIIGPNGSGKSTLLRILAGVLKPDGGIIKINTDSVSYMPQKPYNFGFSVEKNVSLTIKNKENRKERTAAAVQSVGLSELSARSGARLSGGEAQRMAFARILADDGQLILMDEPTSAADLEGTERMERALLEHVKKTGATLIFTTHTPTQAAELADIIIVLDKGKIVEQGKAAQVLYTPASPAATAFLSHWRL